MIAAKARATRLASMPAWTDQLGASKNLAVSRRCVHDVVELM
ncbi:hypothetical protein [Thiomonas bhubaneswarensis]|nr:hypothetical protein [Thiomonas bhubaneswarensis]